jgi:hypothetical protein
MASDFGEHISNGFLRGVVQARAEFPDRRLVRERRFGPK